MDRPHAGSLPPSAFVLMTIYYLQQCEPPVLPVLHEMIGGDPASEETHAAEIELGRTGAGEGGGGGAVDSTAGVVAK